MAEKYTYYPLKDHLGNVRLVFSDLKLTTAQDTTWALDLQAVNNYYPFGMLQPNRYWKSGDYRFGFNGKENDNEVKGVGNQQDYGARIYDPRIAKFLSIDPLFKDYPSNSVYIFAANLPTILIDIDGLRGGGSPLLRNNGRNNLHYLGPNSFRNIKTPKTTQYGPKDPLPKTIPPIYRLYSSGYDGAWNVTRSSRSTNTNETLFNLSCGIYKLGEEARARVKSLNVGFEKKESEGRTTYRVTGPDAIKLSDLQDEWKSKLNKEINTALEEYDNKAKNSDQPKLASVISNDKNLIRAQVRTGFILRKGSEPMEQFINWAKNNEKNLEKGETKYHPVIRQGD